jgi:mRNA interferase YafQ
VLNPVQRRRFKKDIESAKKRGKNIAKLKMVVSELLNEKLLAPKHRDHPLIGGYGSFENARDCHIEPDWLLIYTVIDDDLILIRTGTHSDLFRG